MKGIAYTDLAVSLVLLGGAVSGAVATHFGAWEVLYFVPYIIWEAMMVGLVNVFRNLFGKFHKGLAEAYLRGFDDGMDGAQLGYDGGFGEIE